MTEKLKEIIAGPFNLVGINLRMLSSTKLALVGKTSTQQEEDRLR